MRSFGGIALAAFSASIGAVCALKTNGVSLIMVTTDNAFHGEATSQGDKNVAMYSGLIRISNSGVVDLPEPIRFSQWVKIIQTYTKSAEESSSSDDQIKKIKDAKNKIIRSKNNFI